MKPKSNESPKNNQCTRRHSLRLFHDESSKKTHLDYISTMGRQSLATNHEFSFFASNQSRLDHDVTATASTSFTACAISNTGNETSEELPSTSKKTNEKRQGAYFQQHNRSKASEVSV